MAPRTSHRRSATRSERRLTAVQRRRDQAAARTAAARRAARRRRRLRVLAAVAAVAVVAGTVATLALRGDDPPSPDLRAERVAGASGPLPLSPDPTSYHAVYRAESYEDGKVIVTTEDVTIQRPFEGRVFIREGEPPGGTVSFEGRSSFGQYANYSSAGPAQVAGDAPTVALGDLRLNAVLPDLLDQGLFVLGERRRALGRQCQVYRTGAPLQSLRIAAPTESDYVLACLDATGLILEEVTVADGQLAQRLTATSLDFDVALDPGFFAIEGDRVGPDQGGAEVTELDRATAPTAGYWALDAAPAGYAQRGRYRVAATATTHVDVYVRGTDVLIVRQGQPDGEPELPEAPAGREVTAGALGPARVVPGSIGSTVVAHPGGEAFVHVTGTVSGAELEAVAAALRRG